MFIYNSNFLVNKSINSVFKLIYDVSEKDIEPLSNKEKGNYTQDNDNDSSEDNDVIPSVAMDMRDTENINADLYKILEWNINNNWDIINGKRRKIESIYLYVNNFPEYLKEVVEENDNFIRMRRKHTIVNDGTKYKEIITNSKIINLKIGYLYIIKALCSLKIVKIKEKVFLTYINENTTKVDIKVKVCVPIIINDDLEKYLKIIFEGVLNNIKKKVLS